MNAVQIRVETLDLHQLALPFAANRIRNGKAIDELARQMEREGQLCPVIVVQDPAGSLVLLDRYRRVAALRRLRHDTVVCEVRTGTVRDGLIGLMVRQRGRAWEALEEAEHLVWLRDSGLSEAEIVQCTGRGRSWVRGRLRLVEELPAEGRAAVMAGTPDPPSARGSPQ